MWMVKVFLKPNFVSGPRSVQVTYEGPEIGFLPVYATKEEANTVWPGSTVEEIEIMVEGEWWKENR